MPFYDHWGMGGFYGGFGMIFMLLGMVLMVFIILAILRFLLGGGASSPTSQERSRALHILEERFAHGEIDEAEYNERRRILEK
ncbi:MAG TPA: SHOCT domain-containing protein [Halothiobacillus sp.]|nr:SHOCT domain-containing protein [Halothiobacillus sp.]